MEIKSFFERTFSIMKILVTGSSGLIGYSLTNTLRSIGIEVQEYDIQSQNEIGYGDVLDRNQLYQKATNVDGIVHLAAVSRVIDGEKNPNLCWKTNVEGTENIVEIALASPKMPWLIYASSREVYGEPMELPVKESSPLCPVNIYGESKAKAEQIIGHSQSKGVIASILRFSNVYGKIHDYPDRVIPAFCLASAEGTPIRVDGRENMFDFTYIEDVVQGILSAIFQLSFERKSIPALHLTRGVGITLGEIAEIAKNASLFSIKITEKPSRSFDVARFFGDPTLSNQILNWRAAVSVQEGMHRLINQFRLSKINSPLYACT